jgi:hypothetical protein
MVRATAQIAAAVVRRRGVTIASVGNLSRSHATVVPVR